MAYSQKQKDDLLELIFAEIKNGRAVRNVLKDKGMPDAVTFYRWLENDNEKVKQYTGACEARGDAIFDEIIEIADDSQNDFIEKDTGDGIVASQFNSEHVQRSRLRIDARKWVASKLNPKKYGDKIDHTTNGENINLTPIFGDNPLDRNV
jgi:hypothetical protein